MKWVRHRCQLAPPKTVAIASRSPWWASETTNFTPPRPLADSERRKANQKAPSSLVPHVHADDLTPALAVDRRRHHHADVDYPTGLPDLLGQCIQPQVGVGSAVQRPTQEALHHPVQLLADTRPLGSLRYPRTQEP